MTKKPNYITAGLIEALAEIIYRYLKTKENEQNRGVLRQIKANTIH